MDTDLTGKVAIVCGGSRGIGLACARALAGAGANVIVTSRKADSAQAAAAQIGERALGTEAHAASQEAAEATVALALERFGRLDILFNNAGTNPAFGPLIDIDRERFFKTLEVNLWPALLWTGAAQRAWMGEHGGCVVNNASIGAFTVEPGMGTYNLSKAAVVHATKQLAVELAPKVRVNAVAPGVVRTKLSELLWRDNEELVVRGTPAGRIGEPEDVADAVLFLVSDAARWITGETLTIDGGQHHVRVLT